MAKVTIEEKAQISTMGEQKIIVIQKQFHDILKDNELLDRKLNIKLILETL